MLNLQLPSRETSRPAAVLGGDVAVCEHAVSLLRGWLRDNALAEWRIFQGPMSYLFGIDNVLEKLDPDAVWENFERSLVGPEAMTVLTFHDDPAATRAWPGGALHLSKLQIVIGRWYWHCAQSGQTTALYLIASPHIECVQALRERLVELNRSSDEPVWRVAGAYGDDATVPREPIERDSLVLGDALRQRVETDIVGFFTPAVEKMYGRLNVPYRRGVLLFGDPGNGKTSLIRYVGAKLPNVAAILLRANADFDTDSIAEAFGMWKQMAPAILVIEDLTAVLENVNLSTLLNLLDGVDRKCSGGLMLIASTNHPDKLDPALSNRPGRFDVVMELPSPDESQRDAFLRTRLLEIDSATIVAAVDELAGVSFAHLEEVVRLSGMIAIAGGRDFRTAEDVTAAVADVRTAFDAARTGYARLPEGPFGLKAFLKSR